MDKLTTQASFCSITMTAFFCRCWSLCRITSPSISWLRLTRKRFFFKKWWIYSASWYNLNFLFFKIIYYTFVIIDLVENFKDIQIRTRMHFEAHENLKTHLIIRKDLLSCQITFKRTKSYHFNRRRNEQFNHKKKKVRQTQSYLNISYVLTRFKVSRAAFSWFYYL